MRASRLLFPTTSPNLGGVNQEMQLPIMTTRLTMGQARPQSLRWLLLQRLVTLLQWVPPEQSSDPPPAESQSHAMEVDDEQGNPPPASPVSPADDDLLTSGGMADIEGDLANLTVLSPKNPNGSGPDAST